jgi:hypothetical protein
VLSKYLLSLIDRSLRLLTREAACWKIILVVEIKIISIHLSLGKDGGTWFLDLKNKNGNVGQGKPSDRADVVLSMTTDDFVKMFSGEFAILLVYLLFMEYLFIYLFLQYWGYVHARQVLYHLSYTPKPFVYILFLRQSCC